jgi:hypothetical protein
MVVAQEASQAYNTISVIELVHKTGKRQFDASGLEVSATRAAQIVKQC